MLWDASQAYGVFRISSLGSLCHSSVSQRIVAMILLSRMLLSLREGLGSLSLNVLLLAGLQVITREAP